MDSDPLISITRAGWGAHRRPWRPDLSMTQKNHQQMKMDAIKTEPTEFNFELDTNLKSEAIEILQSWIQDHQGQSPSKKEKEILANQTSLSVSQVNNYFI